MYWRLSLLFICCCLLSESQADSVIYQPDLKHHENRFIANFDKIASLSKHFSTTYALPFFDATVANLNISAICRKTLRTLVEHPETEWASLMLDASGRLLRPGFLSGTITDFGDYDQCMSIRGLTDARLVASPMTLTGRYCLLTVRPPVPPPEVTLNFTGTSYENSWPASRFGTPRNRFYWRLTSALCFPTLCQQSEVQLFAQKAFEKFNLNEVAVVSCQSSEDKKTLDYAQILSIAILTFCSTAVVIGTLVDYRQQCRRVVQNRAPPPSPQNVALNSGNAHHRGSVADRKSKARRQAAAFWTSFSLLKNAKTLFTINENNKPGGSELTCIHGLRVLLISWVIICHSTNFAPLGLYDQPMIAARFATDISLSRSLLTQFVISGSLSVQAFFVISGLISLHTSLKSKDLLVKSFPYWKYMLLRWVRFTPPLLGIICYQFLWPLLGSGPLMHWDYLKYGHEPCYRSWWTNFAFISNWLPLVEQCGSHTWFLSADFQINLLAYFIIFAYIKNHALGLRVNIVAFIIASIAPTLIHWWYSVPLVHIMEPDVNKLNVAFNMIEFNTYNHFAAYFAGLLIAGLLNSERQLSLSRSLRLGLWWATCLAVLLLPFSTYPFIQMDDIPANILSLAYTGIKRFLWICSISWIIYATSSCSKNGLASRILSARIFQPFSRLTFCIYLTQSLVVWFYAYNGRTLHWISHYLAIFRIGGVTLFSLVFAFLLYALFEAPSVNLCKLAFKRQSLSKVPISDVNNNHIGGSNHQLLSEMTTLKGKISEAEEEESDESGTLGAKRSHSKSS